MSRGLEPLRRTASEAVFSIDRFADISHRLVQSLAKAHPRRTIVFRPERPRFEDLARLPAALPDDVFCQIGFIAETVRRPSAVRRHSSVVARAPRSVGELQFILARSYIDDFAKRWEGYLGPVLTHENLRLLLERADLENTTLIEDGSPAGMAVFLEMSDCLGVPLEQVGWVWVRSDLSRPRRAAVHDLLRVAMANRRAKAFQAGVHLKNVRSQRYFHRLGYVPRCVHCVPRSARF